jgi:membrane protein required for colicin V production
MNAVDVVILVIIGLFAVSGLRRGFLFGLVDLVAFGLSIVVAAHLAGSVAQPLRDRGIPSELAIGAGFVIAGVVSLAVIGLAARVLLAPLAVIGAGTPLGWANSVLGLLPGALRGLAVAAFLMFLVSVLPAEFELRESLRESRLAQPILDTGMDALETGLAWAGIDLWTLGRPASSPASRSIALPWLVIAAVRAQSRGSHRRTGRCNIGPSERRTWFDSIRLCTHAQRRVPWHSPICVKPITVSYALQSSPVVTVRPR